MMVIERLELSEWVDAGAYERAVYPWGAWQVTCRDCRPGFTIWAREQAVPADDVALNKAIVERTVMRMRDQGCTCPQPE